MNRKTLQFIVFIAVVIMMTSPLQAETHTPIVRDNSQEVQQTIKNIQLEINAGRAKLMKAREGDDLYGLTLTRKNIPAIERQMGILSKLVRTKATNSQRKKFAIALQKFENLKMSAKANQRDVSLKRLLEFDQSIKAMGGVVSSTMSAPLGR
jgi:hypothetical protein